MTGNLNAGRAAASPIVPNGVARREHLRRGPIYRSHAHAVAVSDTDGQREVAEIANGAITLFAAGDAPALTAALNAILADRGKLPASRQKVLAAAEPFFSWDHCAPVLLERVGAAVEEHHVAAAGPSIPDYHSFR